MGLMGLMEGRHAPRRRALDIWDGIRGDNADPIPYVYLGLPRRTRREHDEPTEKALTLLDARCQPDSAESGERGLPGVHRATFPGIREPSLGSFTPHLQAASVAGRRLTLTDYSCAFSLSRRPGPAHVRHHHHPSASCLETGPMSCRGSGSPSGPPRRRSVSP